MCEKVSYQVRFLEKKLYCLLTINKHVKNRCFKITCAGYQPDIKIVRKLRFKQEIFTINLLSALWPPNAQINHVWLFIPWPHTLDSVT